MLAFAIAALCGLTFDSISIHSQFYGVGYSGVDPDTIPHVIEDVRTITSPGFFSFSVGESSMSPSSAGAEHHGNGLLSSQIIDISLSASIGVHGFNDVGSPGAQAGQQVEILFTVTTPETYYVEIAWDGESGFDSQIYPVYGNPANVDVYGEFAGDVFFPAGQYVLRHGQGVSASWRGGENMAVRLSVVSTSIPEVGTFGLMATAITTAMGYSFVRKPRQRRAAAFESSTDS